MTSSWIFSVVFSVWVLAVVAVRLGLAQRQSRCVTRHRANVPPAFQGQITLESHQKAADYTLANLRLGTVDMLTGVVLLVSWTLLGGLDALHRYVAQTMGYGMLAQLVFVGAVFLVGACADLPLSWYRQFRLEQRFGFNRMTLGLWLADLGKGLALGLLIGTPLLWLVLSLMMHAGNRWWLWAWVVLVAFNFLMMVLFPTVIAPLFNRFTPLEDGELKTRIDALLTRCGFRSKGVFVMDGSKRSSHGNAYFTGLGAAKRIVFFDTLIKRLLPHEVEAVLAHELGHFKKRHITQRMVVSLAVSLVVLGTLGFVSQQPWFYLGLGVEPSLTESNAALALVLFFLVLPTFTFLFAPLNTWASRRHEYEADAFAAQQTRRQDLASALVKLYEDNASTLTPDPLYASFYYSHPPAALRLARLS